MLSLGLSKQLTALVWLAGPLSGLLVQPLVGALSDATTSRYRRRAYIAISATLVILSTLVVAWARAIASVLCSLDGLGDWDPSRSQAITNATIAIAVLGFYVLDFSLNGLQASLRALMLDRAPPSQQSHTNAWHGRWTHLGNILGYVAGFLDLGHWSAISWVGGGQFRKLAVIACIFMALAVSITCWTQDERESVTHGYDAAQDTRRRRTVRVWRKITSGIRTLPRPVRRVCLVQFFNWSAWFPFLFYSSTWIAQVLLASVPEGHRRPSADDATRRGSLALLLYALVAMLAGSLLPALATVGRSTFLERRLSRVTRRGRLVRRFLCILTPRRMWTAALVLHALLMLATFGTHDVRSATAIIAWVGVPWSVTCWVPFALVMESVAATEKALAEQHPQHSSGKPATGEERDGTLVRTRSAPAGSVPDSPTPSSPALQPFRASLARAHLIGSSGSLGVGSTPLARSAANENTPLLGERGREGARAAVKGSNGRSPTPRNNGERDSLLPKSSAGGVHQEEEGDDDRDGGAGTAGGTILGIHNLSIVAPQFFVSVVAAIIFRALGSATSSSFSGRDSGGGDAGGGGAEGDGAMIAGDDVVWVLRFGGLMALLGAVASLKLEQPDSERTYVAELVAPEARQGEWVDDEGHDIFRPHSTGLRHERNESGFEEDH